MTCREQYEVHGRTSTYRRHLDTARRIMDRAAKHGPIVCSVSWGKDSIAMLDLAIERFGRVTALHLSSPYALPGWEPVREHFAVRCDLHEVPAERTLAEYIEWCREIGLPHERTKSVQQRAVREIKKDRGDQWCEQNGYEVQALGMRISEHGPRAAMLRARGPLYRVGDRWKVCPLAYWSNADVWARIFSQGLPYPRMYDCESHGYDRETIRNTGWLSTDGADRGRITWLRKHFPREYEMLATEFPQVRGLS